VAAIEAERRAAVEETRRRRLVEALNSSNDFERQEAHREALRSGPELTELLCQKLNEPFEGYRVIEVLEKTGDARAISPLTAALENNRLPNDLRSRYVKAIGEIGGLDAVSVLLQNVNSPNGALSDSATRALTQYIKAKKKVSPETLVDILDRCDPGHLTNAAAEALRTSTWRPADSRQRIIMAIAQNRFLEAAAEGPSAIGPLSKVFYPGVMPALSRIRDERVISILLDYADGSSRAWIAIKAIRKFASRWPDAISNANLQRLAALDDVRQRKGDSGSGNQSSNFELVDCSTIRELAVAELKRRNITAQLVKPPIDLDPLMSRLRDSDHRVASLAAKNLGELGNSKAVVPLIEAWRSNLKGKGDAVVRALGSIGDVAAVQPLIELLSGGCGARLAVCAIESLEQIMLDSGEDIPENDLRFIATMRHCATSGYSDSGEPFTNDLSLGMLARLAADELRRRGLTSAVVT
jgi:HEAT repeat protein